MLSFFRSVRPTHGAIQTHQLWSSQHRGSVRTHAFVSRRPGDLARARARNNRRAERPGHLLFKIRDYAVRNVAGGPFILYICCKQYRLPQFYPYVVMYARDVFMSNNYLHSVPVQVKYMNTPQFPRVCATHVSVFIYFPSCPSTGDRATTDENHNNNTLT